MAGHGADLSQFQDVVLFLATAGVVVPLFKRLKVSPTLGYLAAGVALGPSGLGALTAYAPWLAAVTVSRPEEVAQLAEFGVVFLLFTIGLELSWDRLRALRRWVFGLGALQVAVTLAAVAGLAGLAGRPWGEAAVLGAALALSSTAVVMPALEERGRANSAPGRAVFSVLLFQDIAVAPILVVVGVFGRGGPVGPSALLALVPAALGAMALVVAGRLLLRPLMRSVKRAHSDELFLAASLLVVIGAGLLAAAAGLSMAMGAFIAGLLLAETEYRVEVEAKIEPFKGLLLGLFFLSVGVGLDGRFVLANLPAVLAGTAALLVVKATLAAGLGRALGLGWRAAAEAALALASAGEFAFVVLGQAGALLGAGAAQAASAAATLSMFAAPLLVAAGARVARGASATSDAPAPPPEPGASPRVLIVGFGRVGRLVAEMLDVHGVPWLALERDPRAVEAALKRGGTAFVGDGADGDILRRCGLATAPALVVTMDAPDAAELVVAAGRAQRDDMIIVARARDARHAGRLYALGVSDAVPETVEASLQLSEAVLVDVGVPMGLVIASIHEKRDAIRRELDRPDALGARSARLRRAAAARAPPSSQVRKQGET